jgi:histidine triad (HIT) family protein
MTGFEPGCPFCAIARGTDLTAEIVCESDTWVAFFPTEPATPGHTLIIPRLLLPDLWALDTALGADLMTAVVRVGRAIQIAVRPEGMNLISSSGSAAEQTVFHLHLHVVPRWRNDGIDRIWPPKQPMSDARREGLGDLVRDACARE